MGRSRYKITNPDSPHFITCTILHWIPVFTRPETVNILLDSLSFLSQDGMKIHAYIILENHMHLIAQSRQLNRDIARFKSYTAKKLIHYLDKNSVTTILEQPACYKKTHKTNRAYQLRQEGVHPELITSKEIMRQKIEYIHRNPVQRGYVDKQEHWRYSSARNYAGMAGLLDVCKDW